MKLYTVTNQELEAMTYDNLNNYIDMINNDGAMISAEMADRLHGTEREDYEYNCATLRRLYQERSQRSEGLIATKKAQIETYKRYVQTWETDLAAGRYNYRGKQGMMEDIKEYNDLIKKLTKELKNF